MSAYALIGRLGGADTSPVKLSRRDCVPVEVQLIRSKRRLDAGLGQALEQLSGLGLHPSEVAIDLMILAALVHAADTRINRDLNAQDRWTREIELRVPVSDPKLWMSLVPTIVQMLNFVTGDKWSVYFRERPTALKKLALKSDRLPLIKPDCVCLFSGGLDSFIGAVDLLAQGRKPIFVSHYWDGITSDHQTYCMDRIAKHFGISPSHVRARVGFVTTLVSVGQVESSLRGRSFTFFALASAAASTIKDCTIYVPENGLISLNVPLDPSRIGALSTRTTHPFYMARWNELLTGIGLTAQLDNPYRFQTKGQMIATCKDKTFLRKNVQHTMSCASPAKTRWSGDPPMHCGHCVPCLIRRAAILSGLGSDTTTYQLSNLKARSLNSNKAEGEHVRAFQLAIARLAKSPKMSHVLVHQSGPLCDYPADFQKFEKVYVKGLNEVDKLLAGVSAAPQ